MMVAGGARSIGSALVWRLIRASAHKVLNFDKLI